ncbi:MAG: glutamate 5-kinase [Angelakisella sp.]
MNEGVMITQAKRIVVKVGTSTLTHKTGMINIRLLERLVKVLSDLKNSGRQVILVTSGAIAVGVGKLGLAQKPADIPGKQATAAVGQCELMYLYDRYFSEYNHTVAQILLTGYTMDNPEARDNARNTFEALLAMGAIPVVNENDTVATEEIRVGDNDTLSAMVAEMTSADALIILSDIEGLYTADPGEHPDAVLVPVVERITEELLESAGGAGSARGTGGMVTKLRAARIATDAGVEMYIMNGQNPDRLYDLLEGMPVGTRFLANQA